MRPEVCAQERQTAETTNQEKKQPTLRGSLGIQAKARTGRHDAAPAEGYHIHECGFYAPWLAELVGEENPLLAAIPPHVMLHMSSNRFAHSPSPDSRVLTPSAAIPAVARITSRKRRGVLRPSWRRSPHLFLPFARTCIGKKSSSAARGPTTSTYRRNRRACNGRGCEAPVSKTAPYWLPLPFNSCHCLMSKWLTHPHLTHKT